MKEALELLQLVGEPGDITGGEIKDRNRKPIAFRPTRWDHTLPPDAVYSMQRERIEWLRSCQI